MTDSLRRPVPCPCGAPLTHSERWDSYYCATCMEWREPPCKCVPADDCPYIGRPETPPAEVRS